MGNTGSSSYSGTRKVSHHRKKRSTATASRDIDEDNDLLQVEDSVKPTVSRNRRQRKTKKYNNRKRRNEDIREDEEEIDDSI